MFLLLALAIGFVTYIVCFNKEFNQEDLGKSAPFLIVIILIAVLLFILQNFYKGG